MTHMVLYPCGCSVCVEPTESVATSIQLLDQYYESPTWDERINLDTLAVASFADCVLGQLFGGYTMAPDELLEPAGTAFGGGSSVDAEWRRQIRARQAARTADVQTGVDRELVGV